MPSRLAEDHANARVLADAVSKHEIAEIDLATVQTNIVIFALRTGGDAAAFVATMKQRGVLAGAVAPRAVRYVTHMDVSPEECGRAAQITSEVLSSWGKN
jgi:threonine aldolase